MSRTILSFVLLLAVAVSGLPTHGAESPTSYVIGQIDGTLAEGVGALFNPNPWNGETAARALFVTGESLEGLDEVRVGSVRESLDAGLPVVVLGSGQAAIDRLSSLVGRPPVVSVGDRKIPVFALRAGENPGSFAIDPTYFQGDGAAIPRDNQLDVVGELAAWLDEPPTTELATADTASTINLLTEANAFSHKQLWPFTFAYSTHSTYNDEWQSCINNYSIQMLVWPVFLEKNSSGGESDTDFFVVQTNAQWDASGCFGFYPSGESYSNRMAGYFHKKILFTSSVADYTDNFDDFSIVPGQNSPTSTDPSVATTTGLSWSLGGSGTVGVASGMGTGSLSFNAGVTFVDQTTVTYPATQVTNTSTSSKANGSGGPGGVGVAGWAYSFSAPTYPGDHCCNTSLGETPPSSAGSYQTQMSWIWQGDSAVRSQYGQGGLPISLNFSPTVASRYLGHSPYGVYAVEDPNGVPISPFFPDTKVVYWGIDPRPDCYCYTEDNTYPYPAQPVSTVTFNVPFAPN